MSTPSPSLPPSDAVMERLDDQLRFYDEKSGKNKRAYKLIKITEIAAAALIPLIAALEPVMLYTTYIIAALGVLVTLLEGLLHLNQYQYTWITYRATAEALKSEKALFRGGAGPYAKADNPRALLAERVEALLSKEHDVWVSTRQNKQDDAKAKST